MEKVNLYSIVCILMTIIIISSFEVYQTVPRSDMKRNSIAFIPGASSSVAVVNTSLGKMYAFSLNDTVGLVLPLQLSDMILNRGRVLQRINLTGISFSEAGYMEGITIYEISGIKLKNASFGLVRYIDLFSGVFDSDYLNTSSLYVSDTISNHVVLGSLYAVQQSIENYYSNEHNFSYINEWGLNLSANDSVHISSLKKLGVENMYINSTGNITRISLIFASMTSLIGFQAEYLYLESSGKLSNISVSYKGNEAFLSANMNFAEFIRYYIEYLSDASL